MYCIERNLIIITRPFEKILGIKTSVCNYQSKRKAFFHVISYSNLTEYISMYKIYKDMSCTYNKL